MKHVHSLKAITRANGKAMNLKLYGIFKICEDSTLGKAKKAGTSKLPIESSKIEGKSLFIILVPHLQ